MTKSDYEATVTALKKSRAKATRSKEEARKYLIKLGVIDERGDTKPEYRQHQAA